MDVALESRVLLSAAPVVDLNGADAGVDFSAELNGPDVLIVAATATVTDADSANLVSATATITNFQSGDNLAVTDVVGITSLFTAGTLTLTGSATTADYETVLQSLKFSTTSTVTTARTITVIANDGTDDSAVATATVTINNLPVAQSSSCLLYTSPSPRD